MTASTSTATTTRLTRRGRALLVLLVLSAVSALAGLVGHAATASAGGRSVVRHVTVQPGETLWSLAERVAPGADPRVSVTKLEAVNHLSGDAVYGGERLVVSGVSTG
jgi:LysM repeat protein